MSNQSTFLEPHEIEILTGRVRHSAQIKQLIVQRIPVEIDADGKPVVYRKAYESLHQANNAKAQQHQPNFQTLIN